MVCFVETRYQGILTIRLAPFQFVEVDVPQVRAGVGGDQLRLRKTIAHPAKWPKLLKGT
jgi:hypothetical protein